MNILFLGNDDNILLSELKKIEKNIVNTNKKITPDFVKNFDFVVSFGYRYIVKKSVLDILDDNIINLHISLLPLNKGSDPNLWSVLDNSKSGVTIHVMREKLDEGEIILQKEIEFNNELTLKESYDILIKEISELLIKNWNDIKNKNITYKKQKGIGSYHRTKDRPPFEIILPQSWDTKRGDAYKFYKKWKNDFKE